MSNLSDKEIDRLSKDAAEFYEPDDSMLSWSKLEQTLVEHIPERPPDTRAFVRMRPLVWGPAVLLLAGITYYIIKTANHRSASTLKTQTELRERNLTGKNGTDMTGASSAAAAASRLNGKNTPLPDVSADGGTQRKTGERTARKVPELNHPESGTGPEKTGEETSLSGHSLTDEKNSSGDNSSGNRNPGETAVLKTKAGGKNAALPFSGENAKKNQKSNGQPDLSGEAADLNQASAVGGNQNDLNSSQAFPNAGEHTTNQTHPAIVHLPSPAVFTVYPLVKGNDSSLNRYASSGNGQKAAPSKSLQSNRSLTIGLLMGPDYTRANGIPNNQLSNNVGISVGYYLTKRLSVNTGVRYTTKNYRADGKPFQPQPVTPLLMTAYYAFPRIESVTGNCSLYEIPLTLRYDFLSHGKTRLFAAAGLSSYLVRNQKYTYFFHNGGRPYELDNEDKEHPDYWFAIGNFSAGMEQDLGKGFSFQAEPFMEMPFRNIGVGNMKMNSFGILFSLRYSPVLGRTRK